MGKIITYKNTNNEIFCQIKLDSKEKILISVAQSGCKIFKLLGGYIPIKTIYSADLNEMVRVFADPKHYGEPILDKIVEKVIDYKDIKTLKNGLEK
ncbi:hypothetical protein A2223_04745 [Candidatus Falkowbacteria bacterium RIFOXYA2_FULL_35_8]|nr:MAG: hypothetical protein A2223_04745 [Candidatus Falkowbacteria bacterium RIFOXYA2_FULL_35_8]